MNKKWRSGRMNKKWRSGRKAIPIASFDIGTIDQNVYGSSTCLKSIEGIGNIFKFHIRYI